MDKDRFHALDAVRGMAALAVLVYHLSGQKIFPGAWVAVDLFFVLSGFVIHHSYQNRLERGMGIGEFMTLRLIRLAPLYWLALAIGAFTFVLDKPDTRMADLAEMVVRGALWIPRFSDLPWPFGTSSLGAEKKLFPLNGPSWSLFFELVVNVAFFYLGARWLKAGGKWLLLLALISLTVFTFLSDEFNAGWGDRGFLLAMLRVSAEFHVGVWIHQHRKQIPVFSDFQRGLCVALLLLGFLSNSESLGLVNALIIAPIAIALACGLSLTGPWRHWAVLLGELSYPLYITHAPIQRGVLSIAPIKALGLVPRVVVVGLICILAAWLASRLDTRMRQVLMAKLRSNKALPRSA
jgi:peptidoglycan/LPS O-acetylase OafA/YrhL